MSRSFSLLGKNFLPSFAGDLYRIKSVENCHVLSYSIKSELILVGLSCEKIENDMSLGGNFTKISAKCSIFGCPLQKFEKSREIPIKFGHEKRRIWRTNVKFCENFCKISTKFCCNLIYFEFGAVQTCVNLVDIEKCCKMSLLSLS